jgi:creatinine amidohydrolase
VKLRTPIWQYLRRDEIAAARDDGAVVLVPLGSTEQHGPHLPVDVDIVCATAVCRRATELAEDCPILVAPGVWSGYSPHHMDFAGSITLSVATFQALLREVCLSIMHHGFRKLVLVNGHGGNAALIANVAVQFATSGRPVAQCSWWTLVKDDFGTILDGDLKTVGHACEAETSMYLHLVGNGVDMTQAPRDYTWPFVPGVDRSLCTDYGVSFPSLHGAWTSGVYGDAAQGSAEKGRKLLDVAGARLAAFCVRYRALAIDQIPVMYDQITGG